MLEPDDPGATSGAPATSGSSAMPPTWVRTAGDQDVAIRLDQSELGPFIVSYSRWAL